MSPELSERVWRAMEAVLQGFDPDDFNEKWGFPQK